MLTVLYSKELAQILISTNMFTERSEFRIPFLCGYLDLQPDLFEE